jgi:hypothetical protein
MALYYYFEIKYKVPLFLLYFLKNDFFMLKSGKKIEKITFEKNFEK